MFSDNYNLIFSINYTFITFTFIITMLLFILNFITGEEVIKRKELMRYPTRT